MNINLHSPENREPWGLGVIQLDDLRKSGLLFRIKDFEKGVANYYKIKRTINKDTNAYEGVLMDITFFNTWLTNATGPYTAIDRVDTTDDYALTNIQKIIAMLNKNADFLPHMSSFLNNSVYYIKASKANINWNGSEILEGDDAYPVLAVLLSYAFFTELQGLQP